MNQERNEMDAEQIKDEILRLTRDYQRAVESERRPFRPGKSIVPYAGRVYDEEEITNLVDSSLRMFLTAGRYARQVEKRLAEYLGLEHARLVNSGSSANLVAFSTLTSPTLGDRRVHPGDEMITVAAGFPTTVAPAVQHGIVPVFCDVRLDTANIDVSLLEEALSERTRVVMVAHTLGNPFDLDAVTEFCRRHDLWLIEDNCDALGSLYTSESGDGTPQLTGTFGDIGTSSFYPAHHITMGEGGAVYMNDETLLRAAESIRDWGRDCWCLPAKEDTCGLRFAQQFGCLPHGYDHKYVYTHFGYNLKVTDMAAAVGLAQLDKLESFGEARRRNWQTIRTALEPWEELLNLPEATPKSDPSWFGFLMSVKPDAGFTRGEIVRHLEQRKVQTRMLFAGNLLKQPLFDEMRETGTGYRVVGELANTDYIMDNAFLVGVYPGYDDVHLEWMIESFTTFLSAVKPKVAG